MNPSPRNRYVVIPPRSSAEVTWNPYDDNDVPVQDCAYLGRVLRVVDQSAAVTGLSFYVTWNIDRLPSYGPDVVAFALGDEWARMPRYAGAIRMTFKTYGTRYPAYYGDLLKPNAYRILSALQDARVMIARIPRVLASRFGPQGRVVDFPLGYYSQIDLPVSPINERPYDVYFAGSTTNRRYSVLSAKYWMRSPKNVSRTEMVASLRALAEEQSRLVIVTKLTAGFHSTTRDDVASYSNAMMRTKLCVVPRGTSLETYRYFEGLRYGCVVIAERLPSRWFYDAAPVVRIDDWVQLRSVIPALLEDREQLAARQRESVRWWRDVCSEAAVGAFVAKCLGAAT